MKIILLILSLLFNFFLIARNKDTVAYVFKNNREGYNVYRIPALIKTPGGKLLAFCEGRNNLLDHGNIDIVLKTSDDNGMTWSPLRVVWNTAENTCGNPSPAVDKASGKIILTATLNNDRVFVLTSSDEGNSWSAPQDITASVKQDNWKWYATGPVHGIQLEHDSFKGRIVIPCNHTLKGSDKHTSHIIYSDDSGSTWKAGGSVPDEKTDECTVAELNTGAMVLNMRNNDRSISCRKISYSKDGGATWSASVLDSTLIEPVCQGALLRYSLNPGILLFSNPAHKKLRNNLSLHISYDEGKSWFRQISIHKGKSTYNDMAVLNNGNIICIYETGKLFPYSGIAFRTIRAEFIKK